jgi:hypothetical protein
MSKKKIETLLKQALLQNGKMEHDLYEFELEEQIDYWYKGLQADGDEFVFVVTENRGHVAMVLITADKTLYINEAARAKLAEMWPLAYDSNLKRLIPLMAKDIAEGFFAVNGVKTTS